MQPSFHRNPQQSFLHFWHASGEPYARLQLITNSSAQMMIALLAIVLRCGVR
jgi:hypothetical protein